MRNSLLAFGAGTAAVLAWIVYLALPQKVFLREQTIVKKYRGKTEQMPLANVTAIKYHYHAVVGFIAVWEFIAGSAASLNVDAEARGIDSLLGTLEKRLPGFSLAEFKRKFDEGDVEDELDVWERSRDG